MYVYMYTYVCMYLCMYILYSNDNFFCEQEISRFICIYVHMQCLYVFLYVCMYACMYVCNIIHVFISERGYSQGPPI